MYGLSGCGLAFLLGATGLWQMDSGFSWWNVFFGATAVLSLISLAGILRFRYWGMVLANVVAAAILIFGIYAAHFAWTFWLFQEPTLTDRFLALLRPQIFSLYTLPCLWFLHFRKESVRKLFV